VEEVRVTVDGRIRRTKELLQFHPEWAARLHERDRVHTYGSFSIADLNL
jgi:S-adenosylmethionine-diacylglycerol 3-amino-3-carboxypropyl transferase